MPAPQPSASAHSAGEGAARREGEFASQYASVPKNAGRTGQRLEPAELQGVGSRTESRRSKAAQKPEALHEDRGERRTNNQAQAGSPRAALPEEVVEDVDESQFIPAYLSSTENEMTDLNRTELNTEYNTSRPLGGHTERQSRKASSRSRRTQRALGGLTDRERAAGQLPFSEVQSTLSYAISQSTVPRGK